MHIHLLHKMKFPVNLRRKCRGLNRKLFHTIILDAAVFYVVFPIMVFLYGWTKKPIAICSCIFCVYFMVRLMKEFSCEDGPYVIDTSDSILFWIVSVLVLFIWVLFSGIGGFSYQTGDFFVRNPMFHDLLDHPWPVYFDMSAQSAFVREVLGCGDIETATYVYYFAWWLPVAALAKIFHWSRSISDAVLFLWAVLGVFLAFYCLVRYFKKHSYWILAAFMLFGGMDFAIYVFTHLEFPVRGHIEWWAGYFQYSSHTAQLYWVFNQSIPVWLILSLLLLTNQGKRKIGLCSLAFAYSPFATIGIIPIAIVSCLKNKGERQSNKIFTIIKNTVSLENIGMPFIMLSIFGSFYLQNKGSLGKTGFVFSNDFEYRILTVYVVFLVMEVLIYFLLVGRYAWNWQYYWVILAELVLIPLYTAGKYNDFAMRVSIPAIYMLMVMVLQYLTDKQIKKGNPVRRKILSGVVLIGFLTSVVEIQRNVAITLESAEVDYINDPIESFEKIQGSEEAICLIFDQYLSIDYKDSFFYKYIAER